MATRTTPAAAKPKKQKAPITPIILGVLCLALLGGLINFLVQYNQRTLEAEQLVAGLNDVAEAVETEQYPFEVWTDELLGPEALQELVQAATAHLVEKEDLRAERDLRVDELEQLQTQNELTMQQLRESRDEAERLQGEVTADEQERAQLQEEHEEAVERLNAEIEEQAAELSALRDELAEARAAAAAAVEPDPETDDEMVPEPTPAEPDEEEYLEDEVSDEADVMRIPEGDSELFRRISYDPAEQRLVLNTLDGRRLVHSEVPEEIYAGFQEAPSIDIYYRVNLLLNFPSQPNDLELIRSIRRP